MLPWGDKTIDFTPPFARKTYDELFAEHTGLKPDDAAGIAKLAESWVSTRSASTRTW